MDAASDEAWAAGEELEMYAKIVTDLKDKLLAQTEAVKEKARDNIKLTGELDSMRKAYRIMLTTSDQHADSGNGSGGVQTLS